MKTLERDQAFKIWDKWWDRMRQEWFKVEVLQDYSGEDAGPALDAWLAGDKQKSIQITKHADVSVWAKQCQEKVQQGVKLLRIHIVEEPLTPYLEYEIEHYRLVNIPKCGEKVYLVNKIAVKNLNLPTGDLMIFDTKRAVINSYDPTGFMTHETFYEEGEDIPEFLKLREQLLKFAKPLK